jgi:translocation and assembly module TamA
MALTGAVYREDVKRPGFLVEETGAQIVLSRRVGALTLQHAVNYRLVETTPREDSGDPEDLDRQYLPIEIASLLPTVVWDRRDDPLNPSEGWLTTGLVQYAFPTLNAEEHFLKSFVQQAYFANLGRAGVLAGSVRIGGIEPLSDREIPLSERFFAGGRTSHRAFPRDLLGVQGETLEGRNALGGNGLLLLNLDYRFPFTRVVGGTLFVDAGNVWSDWRDISLSQIRYGAGVELRYLSPVGPLRLSGGWKLDREPNESAYEIFLSFGHAF